MPTLTLKRLTNPDAFHREVEWSDGVKSTIPFRQMRFECPCAVCRDEHTGKRLIQWTQVKPDTRPKKIHPMGNYGWRVEWADGHQTGIYTLDWFISKRTNLH